MDKLFDKKVREQGFDPDFFRYLLVQHRVIGSNNIKTPRKLSDSEKKKEKRNFIKKHGPDWKVEWEKQKEDQKKLDNMEFISGIMGTTPKPPNPPNRPRKDNFWHAVYDMNEYTPATKMKAGKEARPSMKLIEEFLLAEELWSPKTSLHSEWSRRKNEIIEQRKDPDLYFVPIEDLLRNYERREKEFLKALENGTSLSPFAKETTNVSKPQMMIDIYVGDEYLEDEYNKEP